MRRSNYWRLDKTKEGWGLVSVMIYRGVRDGSLQSLLSLFHTYKPFCLDQKTTLSLLEEAWRVKTK